jgi:rRNA maturation RNase YbeY
MEPPSSHSISVLNPSGYPIDEARISHAVATALNSERAEPSDVRVLLTEDEKIRELNSRFRGLDQATDVLTFPEGERCSGDIAISLPYAERQAQARNIKAQDEIIYLAIHGALHLTGLDDQTDTDRAQMVQKMNAVAAQIKLPPTEDWSSLLHEVCP